MPREKVRRRTERGMSLTLVAVSAVLGLLVTLPLLSGFERGTAAMQFVELAPWIEALGVNYHLGIDGLSVWFVILTAFITVIVVIAGWQVIETRVSQYMASVLILSGLMIGVFTALDLATLRPLRTFAAHPREIDLAVVLNDGRRVVTADSARGVVFGRDEVFLAAGGPDAPQPHLEVAERLPARIRSHHQHVRPAAEEREVVADPGSASRILVQVVNTGSIIDGLSARLIGADTAQVGAEPAMLPLFPEASGEFVLTVQVPESHPAGRHPLTVEVVSHTTGQVHHADVDLDVAARPALGVTREPRMIRARRSGRFVLALSNLGNIPLDVALTSTPGDAGTTVRLVPSLVRVEPGGGELGVARHAEPHP